MNGAERCFVDLINSLMKENVLHLATNNFPASTVQHHPNGCLRGRIGHVSNGKPSH